MASPNVPPLSILEIQLLSEIIREIREGSYTANLADAAVLLKTVVRLADLAALQSG